MEKTNNVRIPQIKSISIAIRLFYAKTELTNSDIKTLFGELANSTIARLKDKVRQQMVEDNVTVWNAQRVNTAAAYKAWSLDINDLQMRYEKLKELVTIR